MRRKKYAPVNITSRFYLQWRHHVKEAEVPLEVLPEVLEDPVMLVVGGIASRRLASMRRGKSYINAATGLC